MHYSHLLEVYALIQRARETVITSAHHVEAITSSEAAHKRCACTSRACASTAKDPIGLQEDRARSHRQTAWSSVMARCFHRCDDDDELARVDGSALPLNSTGKASGRRRSSRRVHARSRVEVHWVQWRTFTLISIGERWRRKWDRNVKRGIRVR